MQLSNEVYILTESNHKIIKEKKKQKKLWLDYLEYLSSVKVLIYLKKKIYLLYWESNE